MATESKDVELRVRARDYSGKTLDNVTKALGDLEKAQADQLKAAKAGTVSARELEASYTRIENAVKALASQGAAVKIFVEQQEALERTKTAAEAARRAQTEYGNSLDAVGVKSKDQIKQQDKLAKAVASADKAQLQAQTRLDRSAAKLVAYGIATDQVAVAQSRIVSAIGTGNAALERQATAIESVDSDIRASAALATQAAAAKVKAAADEAAALKSIADAAKVASDRQVKFAALVQDVAKTNYQAAQAQKAVVEGMRQAAQQAEATAKGYTTLARSVKSVNSGNELRDQLQQIIDPAKAALKSIDGITASSDNLGKKIDAINGPIKEFRATMQSLEAVQKSASGIAAQIDAYRRQREVMVSLYGDYRNARTAVAALAAQMRSGVGDATALNSQMSAAQAVLRTTAAAYGEQAQKRRDLSASLKAAGVDTNNLDAAEAKLVATVTQSAGAVDRLSAAYQKHGAAVEGAAAKQFKFFSGGRTTLDFTQRLKGELLALATAYVGIQGAIDTAKGSLDAFRTSQKIESGLAVAFKGDMVAVRAESEYLLATANRIGVAFKDAAPAYAKYSIAARTFGFSLQETRFTFEKLAIASRDAGLSGAEFEGVLKAVEQMLSKGKIQAEELRGQLGDRLPGAFAAAAAGAKMTTEEFSKAMELGNVSAENVINLARELGKRSGDAATGAARLAQSEAVFQNAVYQFQLALAQNGFVDAYTEFLTKLTALLQSDDGAKLASALSDGFTAVIKVMQFLSENIEGVKVVLSVLIGLGAAKFFFGVATAGVKAAEAIGGVYTILTKVVPVLTGAGVAATAAATGAGAAATATLSFRGALLLLARTIPVIGAVTTAIWLAVEAYRYFNKEKAKEAGAKDQGPMKPNTGGASGSWDDGKETADPGSGGSAEKRSIARMQKEAEDRQKKLDKDRKAANKKAAKDELGERADLIKDEYQLLRDAATKEISSVEERNKRIAVIDKQQAQALATDKIRYDAENVKSGAAAAKKEVTLREQVKNELSRIEDEIAKDAAKQDKGSSFEERKKTRVEEISHAYDKLKKTISQLAPLDKAGAADATRKLDAFIKQRQELEEIKVTSEEVKRLEKELTDQQALRESGLGKQKALYDAGLLSQEEYLANTADIQRKGDDAILNAANGLQAFADAAVAANAGVLSATEQSAIALKTALAKAQAANTKNVISDDRSKLEMQALTSLMAKRDDAETLFKAQYDLRMISEDEYAKKVNDNAALYKTRILEMVAAQLTQLEATKAQGLLEGTLSAERVAALDAQIAKMQGLQLTTKNATLQADTFQRTLNQGVNGGIDVGMNALVESLTNFANQTQNAGQAFKGFLSTAIGGMAQLTLEIAKAIIKQMILNALANSGNPYVAAAGVAGGGVRAGVKHAGGRVGSANGRNRMVDPSVFAGAQRFHEGGLPGLKPDEVPTILQKGEQVLDRDNPNNVLNGARPGAQAAPSNNRFVLLDDQRNVAEAMASAQGENAVLVHLRKNAATVRQIIGGKG